MNPRNPRATVWLCTYKGITLPTVMALYEELRTWGDNLTLRGKGGDANIDRARSKVASWFLQEPQETAGDVLLMVDSDNAWITGDLAFIAKRALEHNAVVGGVYPKRAFGAGSALRPAEGADGSYTIGEEKLFPCEFVGTGFIAIPRSVLERLAETLPLAKGGFWPFFMPFMVGNEYPTDDWAFCARAREAGFQVLASTLPRLTHTGEYTFRMVDSSVEPPADEDVTLNLRRPVLA